MSKRQAAARARTRASDAAGVEDRDRGVSDSQGRLVGQRVLRRHQLPGRLQVPAPPSPKVAVVGDTVEISVGNVLIRSHKVKHDRTREHGALANPGGRPHRTNAA